MGTDTKIYLSRKAKLREVASVIGILAGLKPEKGILSVKVRGVKVQHVTSDDSSMFDIFIKAPEGETLVDGMQGHILSYWSESTDPRGDRLLIATSTPFWTSIGHALVDIFGGSVDDNDCDSIPVDYTSRGSRVVYTGLDYRKSGDPDARAETDAKWDKWQAFKANLKPVTIRQNNAAWPLESTRKVGD